MATCSRCGKSFDVDDARSEYDDYFSGQGITYDEDGDGMCAECAIADTSDGLSGWDAMPDEYKNTYDD